MDGHEPAARGLRGADTTTRDRDALESRTWSAGARPVQRLDYVFSI